MPSIGPSPGTNDRSRVSDIYELNERVKALETRMAYTEDYVGHMARKSSDFGAWVEGQRQILIKRAIIIAAGALIVIFGMTAFSLALLR